MFKPDWTVSPGEILAEYLECIDITVPVLSIETGLSIETINKIIGAEIPVTPEIADAIGRAIRSGQFWLNLELKYREDLARLEGEHGKH